ncbi:glycosyltransferase 87 family protein [Autumnicola musiva]|uniref:Glycosyltransferase 87 family protein n=1 Tax=Autumnicola musiva TaxID=3075589 RepID=A0ABU3D1N8_9FLAO|nr:glycosyltransferase 87 family protein [Zunongwangia sp. F117]MDT0675437.1 glycosyltransferase 87 family protein [Zunongwangia sp. F117]
MNLEFIKYHKFSILMLLAAAAFYYSFGYDLAREDFMKLISLYAGLFFISFKLVQLEKPNFWFLAGAAIFFRLLFLFALPNLSQDFYRFIWDGRLIVEGFNPFLHLPVEWAGEQPKIQGQAELIQEMGTLSAANFTNYPPLNQFFFTVAAFLSGKSISGAVVVMRVITIAADLGILYFGRKLLTALKLPEHRIFWYILNPFIIIEFTGNLHFEGVMLFFLIWSFYLLYRKKWIWAALLLGLSISVKLLPLILLPLFLKFFRRNNRKEIPSLGNIDLPKLIAFYAIIISMVVLTFVPFFSEEILRNFFQSIGLWFGKFEFNASVFYIIRWIGFQFTGYNVIVYVGKILPLITLLILTALAFGKKRITFQSFLTTFLFGISAYFFLSTTVHPWYIATPLLLSVFTTYRYVILWSFMVILSYSAYSNPQFQENSWLIAAEYLSVIGVFIFEVLRQENLITGFSFRSLR